MGVDINPLHPESSSSRPHICVKAGPGCFNNSKGRQSQTQTQINRILDYTKPLIETFAQIHGSLNPAYSGCIKKTAK